MVMHLVSSVCPVFALTFENLYLGTACLVRKYIFRKSRSHSCVSRSLGQGQGQRSKKCCMSITNMHIVSWLHVKKNYFEMMLILCQCFISHVTTSEIQVKLFHLL